MYTAISQASRFQRHVLVHLRDTQKHRQRRTLVGLNRIRPTVTYHLGAPTRFISPGYLMVDDPAGHPKANQSLCHYFRAGAIPKPSRCTLQGRKIEHQTLLEGRSHQWSFRCIHSTLSPTLHLLYQNLPRIRLEPQSCNPDDSLIDTLPYVRPLNHPRLFSGAWGRFLGS